MAKKLDIHSHSLQRKLNLHVQHCNTILFKTKHDKYGNQLVQQGSRSDKSKGKFLFVSKELRFLF
jgi:hypothetical protein